MKRFLLMCGVLTIGFSALAMEGGPGLYHNCVHVISMDDDMFYFRSDKEISGATLDVYEHKTGKKVVSQVIAKKRTIINFSDLEAGDYVILITKGDFRRKYVFHKTASTSGVAK